MNFQALSFLEPFFPADLEWIYANAHLQTVLADGLLVREGQVLERIYVVVDGLFSVSVNTGYGAAREINRLGCGAILGEMAWLESQPASASVRALESSTVLVFDSQAVSAHCATNEGFSSRFLRGVAQVISGRLREANTRIRQTMLEAQNATEPSGGDSESLIYQLVRFKALVAAADKEALAAQGELSDSTRERLGESFRKLLFGYNSLVQAKDQAPEAQSLTGGLLQHEMLPYICLTQTAERFYSKPRGYAGDYLSIEWIYERKAGGAGRIGPLIDALFLEQPAAKAVRNRRALMAEEIRATLRTAPDGHAHVTALACGPAREIFDVYLYLNDATTLSCTALDIDPEALNLLSERAQAQGLQAHINPVQGNLIYLAMGRQSLDLVPQDLMYSIGLIDYFNDSLVVKLLNWIHGHLKPGGRVIVGNFHPRNPDRALMDNVLDWRLIHRDEQQMHALFERSLFGRKCTRIFFESEGVNLFAECVRA